MEAVFELAGSCAAEAFVNLSQNFESNAAANGPALLPFLVIKQGEKRAMTIFNEATPKIFQDVEVLLDQLSPSEKYAVLVRDGYVTLDGKKMDALILEGHLLLQARKSFTMVIPYAAHPLVLYKPKLTSCTGFAAASVNLDAAFARGRDGYEKGSAVWRASFRPT